MKKIEIILEKNDGLLWGRIEGKKWMPTPYGETTDDVISNLKELVADYTTNEGKTDKMWVSIDWTMVEFSFKYDRAVKH